MGKQVERRLGSAMVTRDAISRSRLRFNLVDLSGKIMTRDGICADEGK
jgi:hypothetical protein